MAADPCFAHFLNCSKAEHVRLKDKEPTQEQLEHVIGHRAVYSKDNQPTQAQQEHVTSLKAAGFNVAWVPEPTLQKIMQLVCVCVFLRVRACALARMLVVEAGCPSRLMTVGQGEKHVKTFCPELVCGGCVEVGAGVGVRACKVPQWGVPLDRQILRGPGVPVPTWCLLLHGMAYEGLVSSSIGNGRKQLWVSCAIFSSEVANHCFKCTVGQHSLPALQGLLHARHKTRLKAPWLPTHMPLLRMLTGKLCFEALKCTSVHAYPLNVVCSRMN
eukprot:scaffold150805_cov25-Tisochrysis_lutea.AAC.2